MLVTWFFIITLAAATILIHLEGLWLLRKMPRSFDDLPRLGVLAVVMMCLVMHVMEISLYSFGFMLADKVFGVGQFNNEPYLDTMAYFYYSAITYTAVGYGDILPSGDIRLLAVAESLNGLMLIGWSGAFTFIAMQKLWSGRVVERREARRASRNATKEKRKNGSGPGARSGKVKPV
ncbi:MAG TPA: ion channel [Aestuariivirga sp.]|nr:hypothetical protein [Alphaproteobacteria bacterium]HRX35544.1 ion channel [Aestuariivirga sp.]